MKKIVYTIIAAAAILSGCNREIIVSEGTGSLALDLSCKSDYKDVVTKATDEEIINNLTIDIFRPYDQWSKTYAPFSSIRGKVVELGSGDYTLTASSPAREHAAFEQPIYEGSKDFKIMTGQVSTVEVICSISNMKVSVFLSDNFVRELSDYTITVSNGKGTLSWNRNASEDDFKPVVVDGKTVFTGSQAGYFTVAPLTVRVDGHRAIDNTDASTQYLIENPSAADHHILNLDAKVTGQVGDVDENGNVITEGIKITISHEVNDINQIVSVPGFDEVPVPGDDNTGDDSGDDNTGDDNTGNEPVEPTPSTKPTLLWEANPDFLPMNIDENLNADLLINAPEKIKTFVVTVDSPQLSPTIAALCSYADTYVEGEPADMDMIGDAVLVENLANMNLGLPLADEIAGQTTVPFSLSGLVPLINIYGPEADTEHKFTLKVTDEKGQSMEQMVVFVTAE
ncbi:MAG: DUF4493 domain-containing protein [Bacteroidales bacterium]|nr:DUF4493 domain-containing protein [Bacteroidales bacterium]